MKAISLYLTLVIVLAAQTTTANPIPQLTASGTTILPVISNVTTTVLTIGVSAATGKVYYHVRDVNQRAVL